MGLQVGCRHLGCDAWSEGAFNNLGLALSKGEERNALGTKDGPYPHGDGAPRNLRDPSKSLGSIINCHRVEFGNVRGEV